MKNFQKITLTAITALAMNMSLSASVNLDVSAGDAEMDGVITGAANVIGAHVLTLKNQTTALTALDIKNGQNVAASSCTFSSTDVTIDTAANGKLTQAAGMTLHSLTLAVAGEVASTNAAILLTTATPVANVLTTTSGSGGTTISTLATGSADATIANSDALVLTAATGTGGLAITGVGTTAINGDFGALGAFTTATSAVSLGATAKMPAAATNTISLVGSLALASSGVAHAINSVTNFTGTSQLAVPASVTAASVGALGALDFATGTSLHCADTAGVNLLTAGATITCHTGSSIVFASGAKFGSAVTTAA